MKRSAVLALCLAIFAQVSTPAEPSQRRAAQVRADAEQAFAHLRHLAADEFRGRKSGTPEYRKAAEYVAAKMKEYGLTPGGDGGTWFQEVPFRSWSDFEQPIRLEITAPQHRVYFAGRGRDFQPVSGTGSGAVTGSIVFAGYGLVIEAGAPSAGDKAAGESGSLLPWNDYAGLDVTGKVVLLMSGVPAFLADAGRDWNLERKVRTAAAKGAVGLLEMDLSSAAAPGGPRARFESLKPGACPEGFVVLRAGRAVLDDLFYMTGRSWRDLVSKTLRLKKSFTAELGATVDMEAHFVAGDRTAPNVIGLLPGTDRRLKGECLVMGGHLDHLGVGVDGWIYNGADDNAGSAAVLLETARVLGANRFRPARTIVFAAWAGEELGLRGSRHYVENPVIPLDKTVLYLNLDMVGTGDGDLLVGGMWEFSELFDEVKRGLDEAMIARLRPRLNYRGSDHTAFWAKNVPAISLRTGEILTDALDDEHPEYHRPGDTAGTIDPELLRLSAQYHCDVLAHLSRSQEDLLEPIHRTMFLHRDARVVDMHCDTIGRAVAGEDLGLDLPTGHIDIPKLRRGAVDLQVFACYAPPPADEPAAAKSAHGIFKQLDALNRLVETHPGDLALVRSVAELNRVAAGADRTAVLAAIEGGYAIQSDLGLLRAFHAAGVRLMTLTHWTTTGWADASGDAAPEHGGLTQFGESVVREMNRLGMIIDLSHAHDETFWDVLKVSAAPVVASHSCCRALCPHFRNLSDDMLKALAEKKGLVGINFYPVFLSAEMEKAQTELTRTVAAEQGLPADIGAIAKAEAAKRWAFDRELQARWAALKKTLPPVDVKTVVDHIDHIVKVTGTTDCVGLGSDFDGMSDTPAGLENIGLLPNITIELAARGYKPEDIRKILGGNFLRVFGAVEQAAEGGSGAGR